MIGGEKKCHYKKSFNEARKRDNAIFICVLTVFSETFNMLAICE